MVEGGSMKSLIIIACVLVASVVEAQTFIYCSYELVQGVYEIVCDPLEQPLNAELIFILERARSTAWHFEACQNVPKRVGERWSPGDSIPNRSCEKWDVKREVNALTNDIEDMIRRLR
jgi:hypothetical protein